MNFDTEGEVVATGDLFKQATGGAKAWALRHFVLVGPYFVYYTHDGSKKKGQLDISDCTVRICEPDECGSKNAKYAFIIEGPNKSLLVCASNERNRVAWMILLCQQTEEFSNVIRRYLKSGEDVHANTIIKKRSNFGMSSKIRVVVSNFPRIIIIDPINSKLLDQIIWNRKSPPTLTIESAIRFKITHGKKILNLEDTEGGSEFWREIFSRFPDMKYYVPRKRPMSMQIDFTETDNEDFYTRRDRLQRAALNPIAEGEEEETADTQTQVQTNNSSANFLRSSLYYNYAATQNNPISPPLTTSDVVETGNLMRSSLYLDQPHEDEPRFLRVSLYEPPDLSEFDESAILIDENNLTSPAQKSTMESQTDENFRTAKTVPPKSNTCDARIQTDPIDDTGSTPAISTKKHSEIGTSTDLLVPSLNYSDNEIGSTVFPDGTSFDMGTSIDVDLETLTDADSFSVSPRETDGNELTSSKSLPFEYEDDDDDLVEGIDIKYMNPRMSMMLCNLNDLDLSSLREVGEPVDMLGPTDDIDIQLEFAEATRQSAQETNSNWKSVERPMSICIEVETPASENEGKKVREFSYLELMRRLEAKSTNKKPPTMIMPSSDPKLKTQYFGTQRVVYKPQSGSSLY